MKKYCLSIFIYLSISTLYSQNVKAKFFLSDMTRMELLGDSEKEIIKNEINNLYGELEKTVKKKYNEKIKYTEQELVGSNFDQDGYTNAVIRLNNPTQMEADYLRASFTRNTYKTVEKEKNRKFQLANRILIKLNPTTKTYEPIKRDYGNFSDVNGLELNYKIPQWSDIVKYIGGYAKLADSNLKKSDTSKFAVRTILKSIEILDDTNWKGTIKILGNEDYGFKYYKIKESTFTVKGKHSLPMLSTEKFIAEQLGVNKGSGKYKSRKNELLVNGIKYWRDDNFSPSTKFAFYNKSDKSRIYVKFDLNDQKTDLKIAFHVPLTAILSELDELFESYFNTSEIIINDVVSDEEFNRIVPQEYWNSDDWINKVGEGDISSLENLEYKVEPIDINWLINKDYDGFQSSYSNTKDGKTLYEKLIKQLEKRISRNFSNTNAIDNGVQAIYDSLSTLIPGKRGIKAEIKDYFRDEFSSYLIGRKTLNEMFIQRLSDLGYDESVISISAEKIEPTKHSAVAREPGMGPVYKESIVFSSTPNIKNADLLKTLYFDEVVSKEQNYKNAELESVLKIKLLEQRKDYYLRKIPYLVHKDIIVEILLDNRKGVKTLAEDVLRYYKTILSGENLKFSKRNDNKLYFTKPTTLFHHVSNLELNNKYLSDLNIHLDVINQTIEHLVDNGGLSFKRKKYSLIISKKKLGVRKSDLIRTDWDNIIYPSSGDIIDEFRYIDPFKIGLIDSLATYHHNQNNHGRAIQLYETTIANLDNNALVSKVTILRHFGQMQLKMNNIDIGKEILKEADGLKSPLDLPWRRISTEDKKWLNEMLPKDIVRKWNHGGSGEALSLMGRLRDDFPSLRAIEGGQALDTKPIIF